jgi:hypothetical protein
MHYTSISSEKLTLGDSIIQKLAKVAIIIYNQAFICHNRPSPTQGETPHA